ncbi:hypothetical protein D5086_018355 [Populus alba]|uniref:Uncharacterized protein n=1 Tax=Populus alba TaxID=43335 RepID=A0ACC4BPJ3_POPAL
MQRSPKRPKISEAPSANLFSPPEAPPLRLTQEQELAVMVAALKNVVSGTASRDFSREINSFNMPITTSHPQFGSTSSNGNGFYNSILPPSSDLDTCGVCKIKGGIASFEESTEKQEKQQEISEKISEFETEMGKDNEFLDNIVDEELQEWMTMMMDFGNGGSSNSSDTASAATIGF